MGDCHPQPPSRHKGFAKKELGATCPSCPVVRCGIPTLGRVLRGEQGWQPRTPLVPGFGWPWPPAADILKVVNDSSVAERGGFGEGID